MSGDNIFQTQILDLDPETGVNYKAYKYTSGKNFILSNKKIIAATTFTILIVFSFGLDSIFERQKFNSLITKIQTNNDAINGVFSKITNVSINLNVIAF